MELHHSNKGEFLKCLSEFFKRDLVSIPIVKKYPHQQITQRCGLRAATIELDTAAYPSIEYVAGTRLSVYPLNPAAHVNSIMEHLIDDVSPAPATAAAAVAAGGPASGQPASQPHYSHQVLVGNFPKFAQLAGKDCLRLALTYLFDIMTAPSRELVHLLADHCQSKEQKKRLIAIGQTNESWEKWLCSSHRTLKSLFDEYNTCKLSAGKLLNELNVQQPRQYSISNIKSSKRFRTEIVVVQHKYTLNQIELNLRELRDRETYEQTISPSARPPAATPPPPAADAPRSKSKSRGDRKPALKSATGLGGRLESGIRSPRAPRASSRRSTGSLRSIRSVASFATSPITTHQVKRVSSFSGPLMSAYANASQTTSRSADTQSVEHSSRSKMSLLSVLQNHDRALKSSLGGPAAGNGKFEGLCSNYLLNLNSAEQILCEFVENPRFTLKGNREQPIMMIGQDVGMIAFRAFVQQRQLEHDRAQVFYNTFKDLSPKKFGDMQLVCLTGHRSHLEDLFRREIQSALQDKVLSSSSSINRRHLLSLLTAATHKSQLVLSQMAEASASLAPASSAAATKSTLGSQPRELPISKELLELGDRIYRLLVENNGCLYTCCDPHMTQAIEILAYESIARNSQELTRERLLQLLPKWKGGGRPERPDEGTASYFTLENTYERAQIVQEIYDSSI